MATAIMTQSAPTRIAFLDSLRLIAALLVFTQHLFEKRDGVVKGWLIPMAPGVMGVAIFFFISGYVIPMVARNGLNVREFMVRRLFRIFPLYLVTLALMAVAGATGFLPKFRFIAEAPIAIWAANILLIAEYIGVSPFLGVSWTLAVELVWYAIFAASFVLFGKRAGDRLDLFVPVMLAALTILSLVVQARIPLGRPVMIYAAVIGFQCFRYHVGEIDSRKLTRSIAIFSAVALFAIFVAFGVFAHPNLSVMQAIVPWIVATVIFLVCTLWSPLHTTPLLSRGIVPMLGAMSYSIYLLHPIAGAAANAYCAEVYQVPAASALTLAVSWLGFRWVERPFMRLGRSAVGAARFGSRLKQV